MNAHDIAKDIIDRNLIMQTCDRPALADDDYPTGLATFRLSALRQAIADAIINAYKAGCLTGADGLNPNTEQGCSAPPNTGGTSPLT